MRSLALILLALTLSSGHAADRPDQAQRAALREQMQAVHQQNQAERQATRDACRARIRAALADHPQLLARAEQRFQQIDAARAARQQQRQAQRQQRMQQRQGNKP